MSFVAMEQMLQPIIDAAAKENQKQSNDYIQDELLHCGACHTPKQTKIKNAFLNRSQIVPCMCQCKTEQYEKSEKEFSDRQREQYINSLRVNGLKDRSIASMRFEYDDGSNPRDIDKARRYVTAWKKMRQENIGLLLWGNTGNGKTFTAGCIANALIDMGVPVLMTSFPRILSALNALRYEDRSAYIDSLNHYPMLILDDLGAERQSSYALEQVYSVIDTRYKAQKPLIVTTNLTLSQIQKAENMDYQRIYDRVLELCTPIEYKGDSRRKDIAKSKLEAMREILG